MKTRVTICIEKQILKDVDKIRGLVSRSAFINKFLDKHLNFQTGKEILKSR